MIKQIQLTQGKVALVDEVDYDFLSAFRWNASNEHGTFYATSRVADASGIYHNKLMHRIVARRMGLDIQGKEIDHKNGNPLDNRRSNLRLATKTQNSQNSKRQSNNTSGYVGVYWNKRARKFHAQIRVNKKRIHLGFFHDKIQAAQAYDRAALRYFGEFARLNLSN